MNHQAAAGQSDGRSHGSLALARMAAARLLSNAAAPLNRLAPRSAALRAQGLALPMQAITPPAVIDAAALYKGRFTFAGETVECAGRVVFDHPAPNDAWLEQLHSFIWLPSLLDGERQLWRVFARSLVSDWAARANRLPAPARAPAVTARRVINLITSAAALISGASGAFEKTLLRALTIQTRRLLRMSRRALPPHENLLSALAISYAAFGLSGLESLRETALRRLAGELDQHILPDGGHVSRSPAMLLEALALLIPLRKALEEARLPIPREISGALERGLPMLRFFRHGDGGLALLGGVSDPMPAVCSAVLDADPVSGSPLLHAPHSGYARLQQGPGLLIADCGHPPAPGVNPDAALSAAAFEFSHGPARIITSCGAPRVAHDEWRAAARRSAAHSALSVDGLDAGRIIDNRLIRALLGAPLLRGPRQVDAACRQTSQGSLAEITHDGFAPTRGLVHGRSLFLAPRGTELRGEDILSPADSAPTRASRFTIRFHLHPSVGAATSRDGASVLLTLPDKSAWKFTARGAAMSLEESVLLASSRGLRRSRQIVLEGPVDESGARVNWLLRQDAPATPRKHHKAKSGEPELPLA